MPKDTLYNIDSVPRGLACNCYCPYCHEKLMARHGNIKEHGFAHHSETRGANLEICYMVTLYKLAEQTIQTHKRIRVPSYYDIFKEKDMEFPDVKIDNCFEREDKQPDVIATTSDGQQYLIEFIFDYKVQRKHSIDYKNMNCLEINLKGQRLETVESFLLKDCSSRRWINNQYYFDHIIECYNKSQKKIELKEKSECDCCKLRQIYKCQCVKQKEEQIPIIIENSGHKYKICKTEFYQKELEDYRRRMDEMETEKKRDEELEKERLKQEATQKRTDNTVSLTPSSKEMAVQPEGKTDNTISLAPDERTCFMCEYNLSWVKSKDNTYAHCGCYISVGVDKKNTTRNC